MFNIKQSPSSNLENKSNEPVKVINSNHKKLTDLKMRLISSIVMLALLIIYVILSVVYTEGNRNAWNINTTIAQYCFVALTMILIGAMIYEIIKAMEIKEWWLILILIAIAEVLFYFPMGGSADFKMYQDLFLNDWYEWYYSVIICLITFSSFVLATIISKTAQSNKKGLIAAIAMIIIVFGMKGFVHISLAMNGSDLPKYSFTTVLWIWMTIILTDTFAYFGGSKWGKTPLAPSISPKKSLEGAAIGMLGALIVGSTFALLLFYLTPQAQYGPLSQPFYNLGYFQGQYLPGILLVLLTFVISVLGQIGDLFFSAIKRYVGIKDYSKLIPGHGGILDRLDSFVFTFFIMFFITLAVR